MSVVEIPQSVVFCSSILSRLSEDLNAMLKVGMKESKDSTSHCINEKGAAEDFRSLPDSPLFDRCGS